MLDIKKSFNGLLSKYKKSPEPVKASMWFVLCSFLQRGVSMLTTPIFSRLLTTEEYGQYSVFNSWLELITIFVTLKLGYAVFMRGLVTFKDDRKRFTSSLLGLSTTSIIIWLIIYLLFHDFWNHLLGLDTILMICMFIMMWSTVSFNFWSAQQRVDYKYKKLVALTLIVAIAKPVMGIGAILIFSDNKVEARIISLAVVELVAYAGLYFRNMFQGKTFYNKKYWQHGLKFNIPLIPHYISTVVLNHSDRIMINWLIGASEAGIYSLAYTISQIITTINTAINNSLHPWIYKHIQDEDYKSIGKNSNILLLGVASLNLCVVLIAPEVIGLFAPPAYYGAIWIFPPVAIAGYFMFMYGFFIDFEFYFEKTQWTTYVSICGAALNLILNYIFIPIFGYIAAGYTTMICYLLFTIGHYIIMKKIIKEKIGDIQIFQTNILIGISALFIVISFCFMACYNYPIVRYGIILVVAILVIWKRSAIISYAGLFLKKSK